MSTFIKAVETDFAPEFDSLVTDIIAGNAGVDIELDWLSEYLLAHWGGNCEYIAYHVASLSDWGFSDEAIQDAHYPDEVEITDDMRLKAGREFLAGLGSDETYSLDDPGFEELEIEASDGRKATAVMAYFSQGQAGLCWTLMGGYEHGDLLSHISELGFETQEAMLEMSDAWILDHLRSS